MLFKWSSYMHLEEETKCKCSMFISEDCAHRSTRSMSKVSRIYWLMLIDTWWLRCCERMVSAFGMRFSVVQSCCSSCLQLKFGAMVCSLLSFFLMEAWWVRCCKGRVVLHLGCELFDSASCCSSYACNSSLVQRCAACWFQTRRLEERHSGKALTTLASQDEQTNQSCCCETSKGMQKNKVPGILISGCCKRRLAG